MLVAFDYCVKIKTTLGKLEIKLDHRMIIIIRARPIFWFGILSIKLKIC